MASLVFLAKVNVKAESEFEWTALPLVVAAAFADTCLA